MFRAGRLLIRLVIWRWFHYSRFSIFLFLTPTHGLIFSIWPSTIILDLCTAFVIGIPITAAISWKIRNHDTVFFLKILYIVTKCGPMSYACTFHWCRPGGALSPVFSWLLHLNQTHPRKWWIKPTVVYIPVVCCEDR